MENGANLLATVRPVRDALEDSDVVEQRNRRHAGVDAEILGEVAQSPAKLLRFGDDVDAIEEYPARIWFLQRGDCPHERGLAGAVGAEQAEEARADFQVDTAKRPDAVCIGFGESRDPEHACISPGHRRLCCWRNVRRAYVTSSFVVP